MYIVDTDKLEMVLEQMSKRIDTLEHAIRYMGEEFANTNTNVGELKDMLAKTGDGVKHTNKRIDSIAYDVTEALCAIDDMQHDSD